MKTFSWCWYRAQVNLSLAWQTGGNHGLSTKRPRNCHFTVTVIQEVPHFPSSSNRIKIKQTHPPHAILCNTGQLDFVSYRSENLVVCSDVISRNVCSGWFWGMPSNRSYQNAYHTLMIGTSCSLKAAAALENTKHLAEFELRQCVLQLKCR